MTTIAVFGSAIIAPDTPEYTAAEAVGFALAHAGYSVMTGGYDGIMGAASKGAAAAGGEVIGITVARSGQLEERIPNPWLTQNIELPDMRTRLLHLVDHAEGYVIMPGGIGTLQEVGEAWQLLRMIPVRRPMVAFGTMWRQVLQPIASSPYVSPTQTQTLFFCDAPEQVVPAIENVLNMNVPNT
ncbi:MAG: LOG family protein [Anaerolineae bacterium]|nr:LOG family protein [Anaerolineae bacterium]